MDAEVTLYLTGEPTQLAHPGRRNAVRGGRGEPLLHFIRNASGGRAAADVPPARRPVEASALIAELDDISSGGELAQMILEYERVLTL